MSRRPNTGNHHPTFLQQNREYIWIGKRELSTILSFRSLFFHRYPLFSCDWLVPGCPSVGIAENRERVAAKHEMKLLEKKQCAAKG